MSTITRRKPILRILYAGRQTWRRGEARHENWKGFRLMPNDEFWFVWGGRGQLATRESQHKLSAGTAVFLRSGCEYLVTQEPNDPLSVNFFGIDPGPPIKPQSRPELLLDHIDYSLYEGVTRRSVELFWEAYTEHRWSQAGGGPEPIFTDEEEYVRTGTFCPNPIRLTVPENAADFPVMETVTGWLGALLGDYIYRCEHRRERPIYLGVERRHRDVIMDIAARIRKQPELLWSVEKLAREAGYSSDHFTRLFHKVLGTAPREYLIACRIDQARKLLAESNLTVKEIAAKLGYSSPYFMSRQFKDVTGRSPSEFRQMEAGGTEPGTPR
jgi:AraC-like DNA-binding protein